MRKLAVAALALGLAACSKQAQQNAAADASATAADLNATAAKAESDVKAATVQGVEVADAKPDQADNAVDEPAVETGPEIVLPGERNEETANGQ
jgi:outer membrane lipoprotein-sorting protein